VVRGGKPLLVKRHNLAAAGLSAADWRQLWESARSFLSADGESGKRCGNETIRVTSDGRVSIRLPTPMRHMANAPHGRYVLSGQVRFAYRGDEWRERVATNRAVAYRIHFDPQKKRWYLDASWRREAMPALSMATLGEGDVIGVDLNADHLAAWRLDAHGTPIGRPRTFTFDLSGSTSRRDAQVRHALTRLTRWARRTGARSIAIEDLNFTSSVGREHYGRRRQFRQLVAGLPTSRFRARLVAMATDAGLAVVAVDPAYTSRWGAQHWRAATSTPTHRTTRHEAAAVAIGRRPLGHPIRRRTGPPRQYRSDTAGPRTDQAGAGVRDARGPATPDPDLGRDPSRRPGPSTQEPGDPGPFGAPSVRTRSSPICRNGSIPSSPDRGPCRSGPFERIPRDPVGRAAGWCPGFGRGVSRGRVSRWKHVGGVEFPRNS
jgi:IS605 OrfB family transposase